MAHGDVEDTRRKMCRGNICREHTRGGDMWKSIYIKNGGSQGCPGEKGAFIYCNTIYNGVDLDE